MKTGQSDPYKDARQQMVDSLIQQGRLTDEKVIKAMKSVPRHRFVPEQQQSHAYEDRPLPIGDGQTISAPHMVGMMAEMLDVEMGSKVLEIGTGCGYHAAVMAEIVGDKSIYSIEYSEMLAEKARTQLSKLGYEINLRAGNGRKGWPENAPFDAIYLTCAPQVLPNPLKKQVKQGGIIVAPIGVGSQTLYKYEKQKDGSLQRTSHGSVRFVTMQ